MLRASSMAYAIFIFAIIGISCYALVMLSSVSQLHQTILLTQRTLVHTNESAQHYYLNHANTLDEVPVLKDVTENGMMSEGSVRSWGAFKVLQIRTYFKEDTINRFSLIGQRRKQKTGLYLTNNGKPLHLTGKASIRGNVFVPEGILKVGYLTSNAFKKINFKKGTISASDVRLPKLLYNYKEDHETVAINIDTLNTKASIHQPFDEQTLVVSTNKTVLSNIDLKGNIKIVAKDSLFIKSDCKLEDIIIICNKVVFGSGFKGNVQVFAKTHVSLEKEAVLLYPSSVYLRNNTDEKIIVSLAKNSKILGGLIIAGEEYVGNTLRIITIEKDAEVIGDVYCNGSIDLKGKVIGSLYADRFYLKTTAATYENYIKDGQISVTDLPSFFVGLPLFDTTDSKNINYEIVKRL